MWRAVRVVLLAGAVESTRLAFGSCNKQEYGGLWRQMLQASPDYLVLLGDNVYNDKRNNLGQWQPASEEAIRDSYIELSQDEGWKALSNSVGKENIFATWDDHDYGLDNGYKTFINKEASLVEFMKFFHEEMDDAMLDNAIKRGGVYSSHVIQIARSGQSDFIVKVIMLDTRYFKDPKGSSPDSDILGAKQWSWLENELYSHDDSGDPDLILIGSSIQVLPTQKILEETWANYPESRLRLLNLLTNAPCPNLLILSGDVHMMEVSQATCHGTKNLGRERHLVELTSSGLSQTFANYLKKPDSTTDVDAAPIILSKGSIPQLLYDAYEASYPAKYREHKYKDFYQGVHFSTLDFVTPTALVNGGVQFSVINHMRETVYTSFYPFATDTVHSNNTSEDSLLDFIYDSDRSMGFKCTPHWGDEKPHEYFLHVFCMACILYVVMALPALTVLWFIFASIYYIWFITEDKRRARIEALHKKKD